MNRRTKKIFKSVIKLFLIYILIVPAVYFILDSSSFKEEFSDDPGMLILKLAGIALGIALILTLWLRKDPEMKGY